MGTRRPRAWTELAAEKKNGFRAYLDAIGTPPADR